MGITCIEGFDWAGTGAGLTDRWGVSNSATGLSLVTGRDGVGQALRWAASQITTNIYRPFPYTAQADFALLGFAFRISAYPTEYSMIMQLVGGNGSTAQTFQGAIMITTSGGIGYGNTANNLEAVSMASENIVQLDVWHHIALRVENQPFSGTGFELEMYFDGKPTIFPTSRAIRTVDQSPINSFSFGVSKAMGTLDIDDVWVLDEADTIAPTTIAEVGDRVVATVYPDGDGNTSAWTLFGGATDWQSVDEGAGTDHDGNTTYVSSQTLGQQSLFTFGAIPAATESVVSALGVTYVSSKEAALGGPGFHAVKRTSTTTAVDNAFIMQSGQDDYVGSQKIWHTDGLDATWTEATINSSEFGMEVES